MDEKTIGEDRELSILVGLRLEIETCLSLATETRNAAVWIKLDSRKYLRRCKAPLLGRLDDSCPESHLPHAANKPHAPPHVPLRHAQSAPTQLRAIRLLLSALN